MFCALLGQYIRPSLSPIHVAYVYVLVYICIYVDRNLLIDGINKIYQMSVYRTICLWFFNYKTLQSHYKSNVNLKYRIELFIIFLHGSLTLIFSGVHKLSLLSL